jgi:hypothetical protein
VEGVAIEYGPGEAVPQRVSEQRLELVKPDPFGGSGSTLIACAKAGRAARLVELDPTYVDVIVRRWEEFSGERAVLEGDGRAFGEVALERCERTGLVASRPRSGRGMPRHVDVWPAPAGNMGANVTAADRDVCRRARA